MKYISADELATMIANKEPVNVIDVREVSEVKTGKIPGAINIPLGLLEFRMNELDKKQEYILVCHSGGRSSSATRFLEGMGYHVTNMEGGMMSWAGDVE